MKWWWSGLGLFLLAAVMVWFQPQRERAHGPMVEEVYVWQRVWGEDVHEAVKTHGGEFERIVVLGVEMDYGKSSGWTVQYFKDPISYAGEHEGTGLAIRVGSGAAATRWSKEAIAQVIQVAESLPDNLKVIQVDYDCPSSKLDDYVQLIRILKQRFPQRQFEVTCLPDWLDQDAFQALVMSVDRYVMQVHGLIGYGSAGTLCDPELAKVAAERCGEYGKPFLIALPTYRHAVRLSNEGQILQVVSEGGGLRAGAEYHMASADPEKMAALVKEWAESRPELMSGIIWYRMPVTSDRMNWTWGTLDAVRKGQIPIRDLSVIAEKESDGLYEVSLVNRSLMREDWPKKIKVFTDGGRIMGGEGAHGYAFTQSDDGSAELRWLSQDPRPMLPESRLKLGWVRLEGAEGLKVVLSD